jgi:hypothetical protein
MKTSGLPQGQNIFVEITDETEKRQIFQALADNRSPIKAKTPDPAGELLGLKALALKLDELETLSESEAVSLPAKGELTLKFQAGTENYLCLTTFRSTKNKIIFQWKSRLFRLQRREYFRLRLPPSYKAFMLINKLNGVEIAHQGTLVDLGGGGCRIALKLNPEEWKVGDLIEGSLVLAQRTPIEISAQIRHRSPMTSAKANTAVGFQFINMSAIVQNRIIAIVMDLYRELFSRAK